MSESLPQVYLARHGETAWTISKQHTGRTDIPLTARGEANARSLGERLKGETFERVFVSPLGRARRTCELAGFGDRCRPDADLLEWDYGAYEGRTTAEIRAERPGWYLFRDGCPGGRVRRGRRGPGRPRRGWPQRSTSGRVIMFGHSHFFRVLAARWLGLPAADCALLRARYRGASACSATSTPLDEPAILLWNDDRHAVSC